MSSSTGSGGSSSESESSSSESSSGSRRRRERRHERRHERKGKKEKKEKKRKREKREKKSKKSKREKKHKKDRRDKEHVQRSIITGKRIHRKDGDIADAEGEARRAALLAHMNEGEGVVWEGPAAATASGRRAPGRSSLADQACTDPALMRLLMEQGHEAQASKRQRLASMVRAESDGYGDG